MLEYVINGTNIEKALFLMVVGMIGVFSVLIFFFIMIKVLIKVFPKKNDSSASTPTNIS